MPRKTIALEPVAYLQVLDEDGRADKKLLPEIAPEKLLLMYRTMVRSRRLEESMLRRQRQGQMGTFAPAMGQEAAQVGAMSALTESDWLVRRGREAPSCRVTSVDVRNTLGDPRTNVSDQGSVVP